jgi:hypothetical protein
MVDLLEWREDKMLKFFGEDKMLNFFVFSPFLLLSLSLPCREHFNKRRRKFLPPLTLFPFLLLSLSFLRGRERRQNVSDGGYASLST